MTKSKAVSYGISNIFEIVLYITVIICIYTIKGFGSVSNQVGLIMGLTLYALALINLISCLIYLPKLKNEENLNNRKFFKICFSLKLVTWLFHLYLLFG